MVGGPVGAIVGAGIGGVGGAYREEIKDEAKELSEKADRAVDRTVSDQHTTSMNRDQIRTMQTKLKAAGLYAGPVDGIMGPQTRTALATYQQREGLPQTADADAPTMERLNAGTAR